MGSGSPGGTSFAIANGAGPTGCGGALLVQEIEPEGGASLECFPFSTSQDPAQPSAAFEDVAVDEANGLIYLVSIDANLLLRAPFQASGGPQPSPIPPGQPQPPPAPQPQPSPSPFPPGQPLP
jgi:hypothetical protein